MPLIWLVNRADRIVKIYRDGKLNPEVRTVKEVLDGGTVLPGWTCVIREFFPPTETVSE